MPVRKVGAGQVEGNSRGGQFAPGQAHLDEAGQVAAHPGLTDWQAEYMVGDYVPHDPSSPQLSDQLRFLDGEPEGATDRHGNKLGRGGMARDQWGRPLVRNPEDTGFTTYGAPSSAAVSSDRTNLENWTAERATSAFAEPRFAAWAMVQFAGVDESREGWTTKEVNRRVRDEALHVGGHKLRADRGSYLHWVSEHAEAGTDWSHGDHLGQSVGIEPDKARAFADSYRQLLSDHGLRSVGAEVHVVNDDAQMAGTCDRIMELDKDIQFRDPRGRLHTIPAGTRVVADIKTGSGRSYSGRPDKRGAYAAQLATYAGGQTYDALSAQRTGWPGGRPPSQQFGLVIQVDSDTVIAGSPETKLEVINLNVGRDYLAASNGLRSAEKGANRQAAVYVDEER